MESYDKIAEVLLKTLGFDKAMYGSIKLELAEAAFESPKKDG